MKAGSYLLLVSLSLLSSSCLHKDDSLSPAQISSCTGSCTVVKGRLVTAGGREGLAGATVIITWIKQPSALLTESRTKAKAITDSQGYYEDTFLAKDDELKANYYTVQFIVDKNQYYTFGEEELPLPAVRRDTTLLLSNYLIPRKAIVNLTVPNASQIQDYFWVDFVSARGTNPTVTKNSLGGGSVVGIPKQATAFTTTVEAAADQKLYIKTTRRLGTTYTRGVDSLVIPAGTTRDITVTY